MNSLYRAALGLGFLLSTLLPSQPKPLSAQALSLDSDRISSTPSFYLGVNMLVGGTSALLRSFFTDAKPIPAFLKGAAGGGVIYAGQRIVGTKAPELRFAGLQTVALGANIARNAGAGVPVLSDLTFPVFPLYIRVQPLEEKKVSARISVMNVASILYFASGQTGDVALDWKETLTTGAPVFHSDDEQLICWTRSTHTGNCLQSRDGVHAWGVVATSEAGKDTAGYHLLTHEVGHTAQFIRDGVMHAVPMSDLVLGNLDRFWSHSMPGYEGKIFETIKKYAVIDAFLPLYPLSSRTGKIDWPYGGSYAEKETDAMMGLDWCKRHQERCSW